jgi:hypothetical protein
MIETLRESQDSFVHVKGGTVIVARGITKQELINRISNGTVTIYAAGRSYTVAEAETLALALLDQVQFQRGLIEK